MTYNISIAALYMGIQLGYKTIYLHGNDFSNTANISVDNDNVVWLNDSQSYNIENRIMWYYSMLEETKSWYYSFVGYYNIAKYAEDEGVKIYNLSLNSYIDCFEKIDVRKK